MRYLQGDTADHDHEDGTRWTPIDEAARMLTFKSERKLVEQAAELLAGLKPTKERDSAIFPAAEFNGPTQLKPETSPQNLLPALMISGCVHVQFT